MSNLHVHSKRAKAPRTKGEAMLAYNDMKAENTRLLDRIHVLQQQVELLTSACRTKNEYCESLQHALEDKPPREMTIEEHAILMSQIAQSVGGML